MKKILLTIHWFGSFLCSDSNDICLLVYQGYFVCVLLSFVEIHRLSLFPDLFRLLREGLKQI